MADDENKDLNGGGSTDPTPAPESEPKAEPAAAAPNPSPVAAPPAKAPQKIERAKHGVGAQIKKEQAAEMVEGKDGKMHRKVKTIIKVKAFLALALPILLVVLIVAGFVIPVDDTNLWGKVWDMFMGKPVPQGGRSAPNYAAMLPQLDSYIEDVKKDLEAHANDVKETDSAKLMSLQQELEKIYQGVGDNVARFEKYKAELAKLGVDTPKASDFDERIAKLVPILNQFKDLLVQVEKKIMDSRPKPPKPDDGGVIIESGPSKPKKDEKKPENPKPEEKKPEEKKPEPPKEEPKPEPPKEEAKKPEPAPEMPKEEPKPEPPKEEARPEPPKEEPKPQDPPKGDVVVPKDLWGGAKPGAWVRSRITLTEGANKKIDWEDRTLEASDDQTITIKVDLRVNGEANSRTDKLGKSRADIIAYVGEEEIEIDGQKYKCAVQEIKELGLKDWMVKDAPWAGWISLKQIRADGGVTYTTTVRKLGREKVKVRDLEFDCLTYEADVEMTAGDKKLAEHQRTWLSESMAGTVVRFEADGTGLNGKPLFRTIEAVDWGDSATVKPDFPKPEVAKTPEPEPPKPEPKPEPTPPPAADKKKEAEGWVLEANKAIKALAARVKTLPSDKTALQQLLDETRKVQGQYKQAIEVYASDAAMNAQVEKLNRLVQKLEEWAGAIEAGLK